MNDQDFNSSLIVQVCKVAQSKAGERDERGGETWSCVWALVAIKVGRASAKQAQYSQVFATAKRGFRPGRRC